MSCGGCSGAVERILKRLEGSDSPGVAAPRLTLSLGVKSFDVNLEAQTATVNTEPTVSYDTVLAQIKKTGKTVNSGEADGQAQSV